MGSTAATYLGDHVVMRLPPCPLVLDVGVEVFPTVHAVVDKHSPQIVLRVYGEQPSSRDVFSVPCVAAARVC